MKDNSGDKTKYITKGKPYLVMSKKDEFGQNHQYFYKLENLEQLYNIPTDNLKNGDIVVGYEKVTYHYKRLSCSAI